MSGIDKDGEYSQRIESIYTTKRKGARSTPYFVKKWKCKEGKRKGPHNREETPSILFYPDLLTSVTSHYSSCSQATEPRPVERMGKLAGELRRAAAEVYEVVRSSWLWGFGRRETGPTSGVLLQSKFIVLSFLVACRVSSSVRYFSRVVMSWLAAWPRQPSR